ncbi:MAG TPA: DNA-directed RNA polymerase subunit alpha [Patescibacteria group bacterium]|nr:DNA-directed RNA polymerase subunit alpha [Patescibacteria group bacterium]
MTNPTFKIKEEKLTDDFGEFVIEPLEPGYGHTLGNSLRRVLMVSIPGAAVTSVKIAGVKHKFSTVPGLKENVVDLLINIKNLSFRLLDSKTSSIVKLSVKGAKEITAKDFDLPEDVEIVNKDAYVGSLTDKKAKLEIELTIERGYGYTLSEDKKINTLGVLPTDAIFTPVKRVNYEVSATRVGRQTNLDKLILSIWTNGVISPREALEEASRVLASYFTHVFEPKEVVSKESEDSDKPYSDALLKMTIDELDLPTRIYNSLRNGDIETIGQLIEAPRKDLATMRNMGGKSIAIIEEKLKEKDVTLQN